MGDSLSAIRDDEERYRSLCCRFREKPVDCYSQHAEMVYEMAAEVSRAEEQVIARVKAKWEKRLEEQAKAKEAQVKLALAAKKKLSPAEWDALVQQIGGKGK